MYINWRRMIRPKGLEFDSTDVGATYGKFTARPLERGFGLTLGNSLRRVLLSSLQGAAITSFKLDGVQHEFSTLPGVVEDVTDIVLNLKQVRLKLNEGDSGTLRIEAKGERTITARDLIASEKIEILNPEQHIATLGAEG